MLPGIGRIGRIGAPGEGVGRLFYDDFTRDDTLDGDIGLPPNGVAYSLKAPYVASFPLPISDYGRISSNKFVADESRIVYATQNVGSKARRITAMASWTSNPGFNGGEAVTGAATAALVISSNANIVQDMAVHVQCARAGNHLYQKRIAGGAFVTLGTLTNATAGVTNNGTPYALDAGYDEAGNWWLTVNGHTISGNDSQIAAAGGPYCAWEIFQNGINHVDLVRFHEAAAYSS